MTCSFSTTQLSETSRLNWEVLISEILYWFASRSTRKKWRCCAISFVGKLLVLRSVSLVNDSAQCFLGIHSITDVTFVMWFCYLGCLSRSWSKLEGASANDYWFIFHVLGCWCGLPEILRTRYCFLYFHQCRFLASK